MKNNLSKLMFAVVTLMLISVNSVQAQFKLAPLPYAYNALEPYIDAQTMEIHYSKHHQGYTDNLNKALADNKNASSDILEIIKNISKYSTAVRNNAGGYYNHTLFWENLTPKKDTKLSSKLEKAVVEAFGSKENLEKKLLEGAASRFGSGWVWLIVTPDNKLAVTTTANQDNTLMDVSEVKGIPVLAIDVWEHAYYLKYQNKRGDYAKAILNILNWDEVSKRYETALSK